MAERLGTGLQNHLQQFESARDLSRKLSDKFPSVEIAAPRFFQRFFYTQSLPGNPSRHRTSPLPASRYKTNNMKRTLLLVLVIAIFNPCIASSLRGASPVTEGRAPIPFLDTLFQERTEIVFQFIETDPVQIGAISRMVSIDRKQDSLFTAYANRQEMAAFLQSGHRIHSILASPAEMARQRKSISMAQTMEEMAEWNRYPTYPLYIEMMQSFAQEHPDICRLDTIGFSVKGRLLLCLKISDNAHQEEPEPSFFYSSSIHGDELTGYVLMLRLADYLLRNYGPDEEATRLVDEMQIYINPLSNPDGAYAISDNDVSGATRYNANYEDLNRNYPDFWSSDPARIEKENLAMIDYVDVHDFVMAVNVHGGADVLNYPWDGFRSSQKKHADAAWWQAICARYVDSCRLMDADSYRDVNRRGYIHGGDWYVVHNGRQDYFNVYNHVRELTLEISVTKLPDASRLPDFWNTNWRSLLNYMKEAGYGIRGIVSDSVSGDPIRALVCVQGHDKDSSQIYSSAIHGAYFRPIEAGIYDLQFSAPGYRTKTIRNVEAVDFSYTLRNVLLLPDTCQIIPDTLPSDTTANETLQQAIQSHGLSARLYPNPVSGTLHIEADEPVSLQAVYRAADGRRVLAPRIRNFQRSHRLDVSILPSGVYLLEIENENGSRKSLRFVNQ